MVLSTRNDGPMCAARARTVRTPSAAAPNREITGVFDAFRLPSSGTRDALPMGMTAQDATYQIDAKWTIVRASDEFCRMFRCTEAGLVGRDIRDLLREDWRLDFRAYVARALVGIGDQDVTLPMVAPCGKQGWFKHVLEPILENGLLEGYRATVTPHVALVARPKRWWDLRSQTPHLVWDFDAPLAKAS